MGHQGDAGLMKLRLSVLAVALSALIAVGTFAVPANAAVREVCAQLAGRASFKPPLPPITDRTKVVTTISSQAGLNFNACSSPAGGFGAFSFKAKLKTAQNCQSLDGGYAASGTATIKWKKGKPSTIAITFTAIRKHSLTPTLTGKVTAGQFVGKKLSASIVFAPANNSCRPPNGLSQATMSLARGTKMVIA
jgi:hypothetical protein